MSVLGPGLASAISEKWPLIGKLCAVTKDEKKKAVKGQIKDIVCESTLQ